MAGTPEEIENVLAAGNWRIGYCRGGDQHGCYVMIWPLGEGLWDLEFHPKVTFVGDEGEDVYVISRDDQMSTHELRSASIEWAAEEMQAVIAAELFFPRSRVAEEARKNKGMTGRPPEPLSVDRNIRADPWGEVSAPNRGVGWVWGKSRGVSQW